MDIEHLSNCLLCGSSELLTIDEKIHLSQCRKCGFIFDNPRPTIKEIKQFYSRPTQYNSWLDKESARNCLWWRRLRLVRRYGAGRKLLDVGAGIGQFLSFAKKYFEVSGTEISESAVKIAKEKYGIDLFKDCFEEMRFQDRFDCITLFHVLEHVPNPVVTIQKCKELLAQNGVLIIAVPHDIYGIQSFIKRVCSFLNIGKYKQYGKYGLPKLVLDGSLPEIHLSHFTPKVLSTFLTKKGFVIVDLTLDPYYVADGIKKVIHRVIFTGCYYMNLILKINIYPTFLIVAKLNK